MGGLGTDSGLDVALDDKGNVYTTGFFVDTADFDPGPDTHYLTSMGDRDIFVQKLDADGNFVWAHGVGGRGLEEARGIAVDSAGSVYTTGQFNGTMDFDPGAGIVNLTSAGGFDFFVLKLDADGSFVWARSMGGGFSDVSRGIAVDSAGNVYTIGGFQGTVDFDPGARAFNLSGAGVTDIFIQKLDASGNLVWARAMGGADYDISSAISVDSQGNAYSTGYFRGTVDYDPGEGIFNLSSVGDGDTFVQKLDVSGNLLWARSMGGTSFDRGSDIAVDRVGNVYTTGYFQDIVDFDPGEGTFNVTSSGGRDIFVQKLDASGNLVWARSMGGRYYDEGFSIAVDGAGNTYTTGYFQATADFDPGADTFNLSGVGFFWDIFVQKLDANGTFVWARGMGGKNNDVGNSIAVDDAGNAYTTGNFTDTVDFDPGAGNFNLTSVDQRDVFVQKLTGSDVTPPNATAIVPKTAGPTHAESLDFLITFDDDVRNFNDAADLVISHNGTANTGAMISGGPVEYTVTISGISGDGSFTLAVKTDSDVTDDCGNALASSVVSAPVTIDNTAPAFMNIASIPAEVVAGNPVLLTFDSTEPLSGDPEVTVNGNPATLSRKTGYGYTYIALESDAPGPASIEIRGMDIAGNTGSTTDTTALAIIEPTSEGEGAPEGIEEGGPEGGVEGTNEGFVEGMPEGSVEGAAEGVEEGAIEGSLEGQNEGEEEGTTEGSVEGGDEGEGEGTIEGTTEGEGEVEGSVEGAAEGDGEGMIEGEIEGTIEGSEEGALEGEGDTDGEIHPPIGCNAFNGGGLLSCRCNAFGPAPSLEEILGQLFTGALTVMALVLMALYQRRFW
jgi:hypothetical protein